MYMLSSLNTICFDFAEVVYDVFRVLVHNSKHNKNVVLCYGNEMSGRCQTNWDFNVAFLFSFIDHFKNHLNLLDKFF